MRVTIFDYGAGNLHSLTKALSAARTEVRIESDPTLCVETDLLVLPGVGAFASAADRLASGRANVRDALASGLPCLGICLGMQLLFDGSEEGPGAGLGLIAGRVARLEALRVPQIGWNRVEAVRDPTFDAAPLALAYYANGYVCRPVDPTHVVAWSTHERDRFAAAVRCERTLGVQFHPEKSSRAGLRFVQAFVDQTRALRRSASLSGHASATR